MALVELESEHFTQVGHLPGMFGGLHGSIPAVIFSAEQGRIWTDSVDKPAMALIEGPEGIYLVGSCPSASVAASVRDHVEDWAYLYIAPGWSKSPADAWPNPHMLTHPRLRFRLPMPSQPLAAIPGYRLEPDEQGLGYSVFSGDVSVGHCRPDLVVGERAEIGVFISNDHRRRGLATWLAASCIRRLDEIGVRQIHWHCHASNAGSIAVAQALGAEAPVPYEAYSASLPAENPGDLGKAECLAYAAHFTEGARDIPWLDFHAACAWSLAGDAGQALAAIERLVESGWQGAPHWLRKHWALAPIRDNERLRTAVAALEKQRAPAG